MLIDGRRTPRNANYVGYGRETGKKWSLVGASRAHECVVRTNKPRTKMNQKAVMGGGNALRKLVTIVVAIVALAASATAKIGETYQQVIADAQQDRDTADIGWDKERPRTLVVWYLNGDVLGHQFGGDGREIAFDWLTKHDITDGEIAKVMRVFRARWRAVQSKVGWRSWETESGLRMGVRGRYLSILDMNRLTEIEENNPGTVTSTPAPRPAPSRSPNDCMIIATEAYNRLKPPVSHWANIAQLNVIENGKDVGGHAVLFYQPEAGGNVFMYDAGGTADMFTQSHDLSTLIESANERFRLLNRPERFRAIRWVVGSEATSTKSIDIAQSNKNYDAWKNSQPKPTPSATPAATPAPAAVADSNAEIAAQFVVGFMGTIIFALYVWAIVVCFQKGKPVFGSLSILAIFFGGMSLWAITGACRLAKPHSWWARRKYGPEKMASALRRFTRVTTPAPAAAVAAVPPPVPAAMMTPAVIDVN
jgi:hypothetical protein